jgi:hypothetical protein
VLSKGIKLTRPAICARICLLLCVGLACACAAAPRRTSPGRAMELPADSVEAEQYAVLSEVISERYIRDGVNLIVIDDQTHPSSKLMVQSIRGHLPDISLDLVSDFHRRNSEPHTLKLLFALPVPYVLLPKYTLPRKYPNAQGILTVSMPGLNSTMTESLVSVGNLPGILDGAGFYFVLSKAEGSWRIKKEVECYIL